MKKFFLFSLFSCLSLPLFSNNLSDISFQADKLKDYNKLVGYDLDCQIWKETRENVVSGQPSLLVHGFGASPVTMIEWTKVAGPNKIPGDIVTFRFADATDTNTPDFSQLNLGQKSDMLSLLVAFKAMKDTTGNGGWNTYGQSRGAATIVNTLAILNKPVNTWHHTLQKSQITDEERVALLESIKKGVVVLETPLVTTASGIHGNGKLVINRYVDLPDKMTSLLCSLGNNIVFPIISRGNYVPWGEQALSSVDALPNELKVLLHFQHNDQDVSNQYDALFTKKMLDRLGKNNVWASYGDDGKKELDDETWQALQEAVQQGTVKRLLNRKVRAHNAGSETLLKKGVISALYKEHGGAYLNDEKHLKLGQEIIEASCVDPNNVENHFKNLSQKIM